MLGHSFLFWILGFIGFALLVAIEMVLQRIANAVERSNELLEVLLVRMPAQPDGVVLLRAK